MLVPADAQSIIGRTVLSAPTGESDEFRAATVAAPIIARFKAEIEAARRTGRVSNDLTADEVAARYREEKALGFDETTPAEIEDVVRFVLREARLDFSAYARSVREAHNDVHDALRLMPLGGQRAAIMADEVTGRRTPFDAHIDAWKPNAGLKPRQLDQAVSSVKQFARDVDEPIESLSDSHVQNWVEKLINADGKTGLSVKTVHRKLSELRNYWQWLCLKRHASRERKPFTGLLIREPAERRQTKAEGRQRWTRENVARLWNEATQRKDKTLASAIKIAAYSGARIEGVAQLRVSGILTDPETKIRFMCMTDKSAAGDRHVPIHPAIAPLIDDLTRDADRDGFLIHSTAQNKYGERSQPLGKRLGRLKTDLGFDERYVFHSIRKTVANQFENALCPEGVAADIIGHVKPSLTYGLYGGVTRMDLRAEWLAKAISYPEKANASSASTGSKPES